MTSPVHSLIEDYHLSHLLEEAERSASLSLEQQRSWLRLTIALAISCGAIEWAHYSDLLSTLVKGSPVVAERFNSARVVRDREYEQDLRSIALANRSIPSEWLQSFMHQRLLEHLYEALSTEFDLFPADESIGWDSNAIPRSLSYKIFLNITSTLQNQILDSRTIADIISVIQSGIAHQRRRDSKKPSIQLTRMWNADSYDRANDLLTLRIAAFALAGARSLPSGGRGLRIVLEDPLALSRARGPGVFSVRASDYGIQVRAGLLANRGAPHQYLEDVVQQAVEAAEQFGRTSGQNDQSPRFQADLKALVAAAKASHPNVMVTPRGSVVASW